jgi:hypothetical protein
LKWRFRDGVVSRRSREYLITFNDEWVPDHTAEQLREKATAARAVIEEMQDGRVRSRRAKRVRFGLAP